MTVPLCQTFMDLSSPAEKYWPIPVDLVVKINAEWAPGNDYIYSSYEVHIFRDSSLEQVMKPTPTIYEISLMMSL